MDKIRRQIRQILESSQAFSSVAAMARDPEISLSAYQIDSGDPVGEVEIYLAESGTGWYIAVFLVQDGEAQLVVPDEYIEADYDSAVEAAVLRANDALGELGLAADL
jgi:hypothetical protein